MFRRITAILPRMGRPALAYKRMISTTKTSAPLETLSPSVRKFVEENAKLCQPDQVHICDGSEAEGKELIDKQLVAGRLIKLSQYENCYLARTSKADVARVESKTVICTDKMTDAIPITAPGVKSSLGNWKDPKETRQLTGELFDGCMKGRTMYVIPFSMGPLGSPLAKIGIQLTDSEYVVSSMRIMTRVGKKVMDILGDGHFVRCLHSVGYPLGPGREDVPWPCNPENLIVSHFPATDEIISFGSGYGGNSLLGKKCFALRIASTIARREGWLAEHMLILGLTSPKGEKKYVAAAFPSQCGKTNLAMIQPSLPGWKAECVGDDIAWMKFDENGVLRAINPEYGFFGVAPGTNHASNPNAMECFKKNSIFTNVAYTSNGGVYWEGLEKEVDLTGLKVTNWLGKDWTPEKAKELGPAAHSNSRFCSPASQCPSLDPNWEDPRGVPISAVIFGGRRPATVPLVFESFNWGHGTYIGSTMKSEATSAAEHSGKAVMHDPFAMRPFFGYSFSQYVEHWLGFEGKANLKLPKIFHVNWFRKNENNKFIWPGFGENSRVLEWIFHRCNNEDIAMEHPMGLIPKPNSLNLDGLDKAVVDSIPQLFEANKKELMEEVDELEKFYNEQLPGEGTPQRLSQELAAFRERINKIH